MAPLCVSRVSCACFLWLVCLLSSSWLVSGSRLGGLGIEELKVPLAAKPLGGAPPVVLWHGMGDTYSSSGMSEIADTIKSLTGGAFVYSVRISDDASKDREFTFLGDMNAMLAQVCDDLAKIPELQDGFNAIGFSQGGQFLRAYVQRCNKPRVKNLVTMGGQHMGVSNYPGCLGNNPVCRSVRALLELGAYNPAVQKRVVQAQYFRDTTQYDVYLRESIFQADINNERSQKNATYKENLLSLQHLVLYEFQDDITVVPRISSLFGEVVNGHVIPYNETDLYKEDWIGLKGLDDAGRLFLGVVPHAVHMQINLDWFKKNVIQQWFV